MKYQNLTQDDQRAILASRQTDYERSHFTTLIQLNEQKMNGAADDDPAIQSLVQRLSDLDDAHAITTACIDGLSGDTPVARDIDPIVEVEIPAIIGVAPIAEPPLKAVSKKRSA